MSKILITGGSGRLAAELKKHLEGEYVGIENFDIAYDIPGKDDGYDLIVHMAAYTSVVKAQKEDRRCFDTNVFGTYNLVKKYKNTPFVYISTEYANVPLGVYALTKRLGEEIVKTHPRYLILRTSFKPRPFPFPKAYGNQHTQGGYVDDIAKLIAKTVNDWDKQTSYLTYVGNGRKTMLELARQTRPDVEENTVEEYNKEIGINLIPKDYE